MFSGPLRGKIWLAFKAFFQMPFDQSSLIIVQIKQAGLPCLYVFDYTLINVLKKFLNTMNAFSSIKSVFTAG